MPGPKGALSVRVTDGETDRHVTQHVRTLGFTKVAPGGHQSTRCGLLLPRGTFRALGPQDKIYIYDKRTARTVSEGYLENPTPTDGPGGQRFDLSAVGGMALANDEARALVYIDRDTAGWTKDVASAASANYETDTWPSDPTANRIKVQLNPGTPLGTNDFAGADYRRIRDAAMNIGAISIYCESGKVDAGYVASFVSPGNVDNIGGAAAITTGPLASNFFTGTDFPNPTDYCALRLIRIGAATNVADDTTWTAFRVVILGQRMDRHGTLLAGSTGMVSTAQVLASQVAEDLLGRLLTMCDPATANIEATSWGIDQLTYPDSVKAAGVLNDLARWEPDMLWEIGETQPNGLHRFAYRAWPTTPRYEVSVKDGWRQTGSDTDLCNRILVSWTDVAGQPQTVSVTADDLGLAGIGLPVDALGTRIKDADPITLPQGLGSQTNAERIGGEVLADKINPPKAGTIVVRRPILDHLTGSLVMPWEIEPGYLVRVRETGDELRLTQMSYDDASVSATLTLGRPVLTADQRVARLSVA